MKISNEYPPNYEAIKVVFPECEKFKAIFCYGEVIYNPFKANVTPDLVEHESTHSKQQGKTPELWWEEYLYNPTFRLEQETEAYRAQYKFVKKNVKDREAVSWFLNEVSRSLSSILYGNLVSFAEARKLIRNVV